MRDFIRDSSHSWPDCLGEKAKRADGLDSVLAEARPDNIGNDMRTEALRDESGHGPLRQEFQPFDEICVGTTGVFTQHRKAGWNWLADRLGRFLLQRRIIQLKILSQGTRDPLHVCLIYSD